MANSVEPYKQVYEKFLENQDLYDMPEHDSDDENDPSNKKAPTGIMFYSHLKKHPKLLSFTLDKQYVKSKED